MKRLVTVLATLLLASACNGSKSNQNVGQPSAAPTPTVSPCPVVHKKPFPWPAQVPKDLPQPPAATYAGVRQTTDGLTIVRFSTAQSLQDAVLFVIKQVQKAGYQLGRGDAEPGEADAPFGQGDLRGVYKMVAVSNCTTDWLVATTRVKPTSNSPLLPTPSHGPSSSPLPFGG